MMDETEKVEVTWALAHFPWMIALPRGLKPTLPRFSSGQP